MGKFSNIAGSAVASRLDPYADAFAATGAKYGLAPELLMALAAHESSGQADATGPRNANGTYDYGLMQVNGDNYDGDPSDLLTNVALNVDIGGGVIADTVRQTGGDVLWAISAYNRGLRDTYNGQSLANGRLPDGTFPNQLYVDDVVRWFQYFRQQAGKPDAPTLGNIQEAGLASPFALLLVLGLVVGLFWVHR